MKITTQQRRVQSKLLRWYHRHGRQLPWRTTRDPYRILVSEVMLQQTQVDRVIPKYRAWLLRWPTVHHLARAQQRAVLKLWSGLGYNRRALYLHRTANQVVTAYGGKFPSHQHQLLNLPGIGQYTSRAVAVFAYRQVTSMIDTNVRRVLSRVFFGVGHPTEKKLARLAGQVVPSTAPDTWHHALMDLGALICTSRRPDCEHCPLKTVCRAYPAILTEPVASKKPNPPFHGSDRFWRGRIMAALVARGRSSEAVLARHLQTLGKISIVQFQRILTQLERDGLVRHHRRVWTLPT